MAERLAAGLSERCEFVSAFALLLPAFAIDEILGLEHSRHSRVKEWADDILSVAPAPPDAKQVLRVRAAIAELTRHLEGVVRSRSRDLKDDVASDLLRARVDGQALSEREIVDFLFTLLLGGLETTTRLLGNAMVLLAKHPELLALLRAQPARIPQFIDEMIRFDGPSQALPRVTTTEVELAGVHLPPNTLVLALVGSANRDEDQFPNADDFDITRGQLGLQFGFGIHYCIGAALARLEVTTAVQALVARLRSVDLTGELTYNRPLTVRVPVHLPLHFALHSPSFRDAPCGASDANNGTPSPALPR